ncbi:MAG TPA: hypothetical protein DHV25_04600 [Candidatus Kerfeldbacteria bacterium]|nr:hypothetical protein [Candidatus Kerfeldbacteria bacterium]
MRKVTIREWFIIAIALIAVSSSVWGYYHPKTIEVPVNGEYRDATKIKLGTKRVPIATRPVTTTASRSTPGNCPVCPEFFDCAQYEPPVSDGIVACEVVALDEKIDGFPVTAKAKCPKSKVAYDVASVIVPASGETRIFIKPEKRSLFSFENDKEVGLRYGLRPEVDLFGRWTFIRIGEMYGSIYGEVSSGIDANANMMIEVSYRW